MANFEKINFNISPKLKRDVERLACSHGKTLSAFMLDICDQLSKANADRIKEQAQREQEPINFGGNVQTSKTVKTKKAATKKPAAQVDLGGDDNE